MKHTICPTCGEGLDDRWCFPRMLRQHCSYCGWDGKLRIPEQQEVTDKKKVSLGVGHQYTVYDRFGHVMVYSQAYPTEAKALEALEAEMKHGETDEHAGPYTAILWPASVEVQGRIFHGVSEEERQEALCILDKMRDKRLIHPDEDCNVNATKISCQDK